MPTTPPTISAAPTAPQRGDKATFSNRVDAFVTWLVAAVSQFGAVATNVNANAAEAFTSATTASTAATTATDAAAAAATTAGATLWVSGQSVTQDAAKISPLDRQTYRRKTATGSGTTDPSLDTTNYVLLSVGQTATVLLGTATVGSPVANIDFLNLFTDQYSKYVIEVGGIVASAADIPRMQLAIGGSPATGGYASGGAQPAFDSAAYSLTGGNPTALGGAVTVTVEVRNVRTSMQVKGIGSSGFMQGSTNRAILEEGAWGNSAVASGFRLFWGSGSNFTAGTVRVYGVRA